MLVTDTTNLNYNNVVYTIYTKLQAKSLFKLLCTCINYKQDKNLDEFMYLFVTVNEQSNNLHIQTIIEKITDPLAKEIFF